MRFPGREACAGTRAIGAPGRVRGLRWLGRPGVDDRTRPPRSGRTVDECRRERRKFRPETALQPPRAGPPFPYLRWTGPPEPLSRLSPPHHALAATPPPTPSAAASARPRPRR